MTTHKYHTLVGQVTALAVSTVLFGFSTKAQDIEQIVNSRIIVTKTTAVFDTAKYSVGKPSSKNIASVAWSPDGKKLLIDIQGSNQYYSIASVKLDGDKATTTILSSGRVPQNSRLHDSNPAWHPKGKHFVFVGQNGNSTEFKRAMPGEGLFCNLWLGNSKGNNFWQLTDYISSFNSPKGATMPRFSPDGKKLFWTNCQGQPPLKSIHSERALVLADFSLKDDTPEINIVQTFQPGNAENKFYESYGFSPDGKSLLYAANLEQGQDWFGMDICTQPVNSTVPKQLTTSPTVWDRYASFSPNGKKIVWSSSEGYSIAYLGPGGSRWQQAMISELWIMNRDGSEKRRITGFNDRTNPQYIGQRCFFGMIAWNPVDSKKLAVILHKQFNVYNNSSTVMIIELGNQLSIIKP